MKGRSSWAYVLAYFRAKRGYGLVRPLKTYNKDSVFNPNITNKNNQSQLQFYFWNADSIGIGISSLKQG